MNKAGKQVLEAPCRASYSFKGALEKAKSVSSCQLESKYFGFGGGAIPHHRSSKSEVAGGNADRCRRQRGRFWSIGLAGLYCVLALVGCASRPIADGSTVSRSSTMPRTATTVPHTATRVSHTSTASKERIPRPDRSLLVVQPSPDCEFKGPLSNPMTAEKTTDEA
jgi:hypothetical protein